jgi:hypothetical protein
VLLVAVRHAPCQNRPPAHPPRARRRRLVGPAPPTRIPSSHTTRSGAPPRRLRPHLERRRVNLATRPGRSVPASVLTRHAGATSPRASPRRVDPAPQAPAATPRESTGRHCARPELPSVVTRSLVAWKPERSGALSVDTVPDDALRPAGVHADWPAREGRLSGPSRSTR